MLKIAFKTLTNDKITHLYIFMSSSEKGKTTSGYQTMGPHLEPIVDLPDLCLCPAGEV